MMTKANVDASGTCAKLDALSVKVRASAAQAVRDNTRQLLARVQDKLSGDVLNVRSGALLRSIVETGLHADASGVADSVTSDGSVAYARIQEWGGRVNIPEIVPLAAKVLAFEYGGKLVFARHVAAHSADIPERSFLRSSLAEQTQAFTDDIARIATGDFS
jgi:hypothetical protein